MRSKILTFFAATLLFAAAVRAQTPNDVLNILVQKGTITREEADSIRADYAIKQQDALAKARSFPLGSSRLLQLSGYTQVRYNSFQQKGKADGFDIRRARLDFQGDFTKKWGYRLLIDFAGNSGANGSAATGGALVSPLLLDAFVAYKPGDYLKVTAGQFTIPFSLENLTQDRLLETADRSQVVSALVSRKGDGSNNIVDSVGNQNGRDLGLQFSGSLFGSGDRKIVDYYLALLNGAGIDVVDNNEFKDFVGRLAFHPVKALSIAGNYYNGFDRFSSSPTKDQNRIRWGGDLLLDLNRFTARAEWLKGEDGNVNPTVHEGWYAQGSYFVVPKIVQLVFRYDTYNPNKDKVHVTNTYYVFGTNLYFNSWTKLQLNYSRRTESGADVNNDLLTAQLQISF
ncbi:MAG: porin [Bacteroidota bacterium]|nr:porin [Bacteroidota bacterium]MDP4217449.1 porin [Bacteroidota bacterium]MDP4246387.1 porin [Bacteroidota bacterium]MDP4255410.1 porin [Bacteroidota bacterium]MDP4259245.1 porin [Bacteroidota bacterium]